MPRELVTGLCSHGHRALRTGATHRVDCHHRASHEIHCRRELPLQLRSGPGPGRGGTVSSSRVIAGPPGIFLSGNYPGVRPGLRVGQELLLPIQLDGQDPTCWNQLTQSSI